VAATVAPTRSGGGLEDTTATIAAPRTGTHHIWMRSDFYWVSEVWERRRGFARQLFKEAERATMEYESQSHTLPVLFVSGERSNAAQSQASGAAKKMTTTAPLTYLYLALYAFALVGLELVLLAVEPLLGLPEDGFWAQIVHWALTIFVWMVGAVGFLTLALRRTDFGLRGEAKPRMGVVRWLAVAALVVVTLASQWTIQGGVVPPVAEHNALVERFGDAGTVAWFVQVAYYFAEVLVIVLIIGFGQIAGERWFRRKWIPWGGILLAMTWGLVHFLTQDVATGIYGIALSLVMGAVHTLARNNLFITYPLLLALFIL